MKARLLLAVTLLCGAAPAFAAAHKAAPKSAAARRALSPDLTAVAEWGRKVTAAQQPVFDVYQRCQPVSARAVAALSDRSAVDAVMPEFIACTADMETTARVAGQALAAVGPMPRALEAEFKMDSAAYVRRCADSIIGVAASLGDLRAGLEAAKAGDRAAAQTSLVKFRAGAVAIIDAQILNAELIRKGAPTQSTRALFDLRLVVTRAMRVIVAAPVTAGGVEVGDSLHALAPSARDAASRVQSGWAADSARPRQLLAGMNDPRRKAILAQIDRAYAAIAARGQDMARTLESGPAGVVSAVDVQAFGNAMAQFELFINQTAASLSATVRE